ncbi:MAG: hypothetical protein KF712_11970 [Akkermansiaceae bacterium]|nr:hypothetical protein [Akkermansiaceae bacterium]
MASAVIAVAPVSMADLVVKNSAGDVVTSWAAGETAIIDPRFIDIRIENTGTVAVGGLSATAEGTAAVDFSVTNLSATTIPASSSVTARIRFAPQELGSRQAVLRISSSAPSVQETTLDLSGTGSMTFSPIVNDPSGIQSVGPGPSGRVYDFGIMTLNFLPTDQAITYQMSPEFSTNVSAGGIVYGNYQGALFPYRASFQQGPPPARISTMTLSMAMGTAFADFDARLDGSGGTVAIQGDGKVIVTGRFSMVGVHRRERIVRLNADGSVDPSFLCSLDDVADSVAVDPSGRILICGYFETVNGIPMPGLARLNVDGSLDSSFAPISGFSHGLRVVSLPDGKVLINPGMLRRLNVDGSIDGTFTETPVSSPFNSFAVQDDGKIVANTDRVRRYNADGTLDSTFTADVASVTAIAIQNDGKIIVGGHFDVVGGVARKRVARLNADGTLDSGFAGAAFAASEAVSCVAVQEDGGVIISGTFISIDGAARPCVARLNPDGTLDRGFAPAGSGNVITGMSLAADGSVFVAGQFQSIGSESRRGFAKLRNRSCVAEFGIEGGNTLRWRRSGSAPALSAVTFSVSTDSGHSWTVLGSPERSGDSWILGPVSLPSHGFVRASGGSVLSSRGFGLIRESKLFGRGPTAVEEWRTANFGAPLNEGSGADSQDFDRDGHRNLVEYAFASDPKTAGLPAYPSWQAAGSAYGISFTKPAAVTGITYSAEWSETMGGDDWHPAEDLSVGDAKSFRVPVGTEERKFFRLKVANP